MKDGCYNLLLAAAAACPWPDRSAMDISCVADLDSGALALTKEASGNSRVVFMLVDERAAHTTSHPALGKPPTSN